MNFKNDLPIYIQIMDLIKIQIVNGEVNIGDKLLSVRDFAKELRVNPNTVQRAYQELEQEEIVETKRGMGTFIKENPNLFLNLKDDLAKRIVVGFVEDISPLNLEKNEVMEMVKEELKKEV